MKIKFFLITALLFGISISSADAQYRKRSQNQKHRVGQGIRSGELTKKEAKNLIGERKEIHRQVKLAKADGKITPIERKIIRREQRQQSHSIYRKKHNNRARH